MSSPHVNLRTLVPDGQAWFVSTPHHVQYLTGFQILVPDEREGFCVVTTQQTYLIQASFSPSPHDTQLTTLKGCSLTQLKAHLEAIVSTHHISELLFEEENLTVAEHAVLTTLKVTLKPLFDSSVWQLRMIKNESEIQAIRQASQLISSVMNKIVKSLKIGVTEQDLSLMIKLELLKLGAEGESFPSIVAFGEHSALPHHQPTNRVLKKNTAVLIDTGAQVSGYKSDMTRTLWFGDHKPTAFQKIETAVQTAYAVAYDRLKESAPHFISAAEIDTLARDSISQAGYGQCFTHTTGHGVGLDIHEPPSLNQRNQQLLKAGMCVTIEPGIYLEGQFGYRHENTLLLTSTNAEELTVS